MIVGIFISKYPPNSYTTLQAMKNMVTTYGIPDVVIPDNGSEFINNSILALARELQITLQPSQVKPLITNLMLKDFLELSLII